MSSSASSPAPASPAISAIDYPAMMERRAALARQYLHGKGIEIGALHQPLVVGPDAEVTYVDRMTVDELRSQYPDLAAHNLTRVDRVDDGETLATFADNSQDFIIANHMLEHCENPIGTIRSHLAKVSPGGLLYYAIPDKRYTFDVTRPLTEWDHFLRDDREGSEWSRWGHYVDYIQEVHKIPHPESERHAKGMLDRKYSIHFHVWDYGTFMAFLESVQRHVGGFAIEHLEQNGAEAVAVLKKNG